MTYTARVRIEEAEAELASADELVPCVQAPLVEAKALRDACLEREIPVLLDRGACCGAGGCGCAPKLELLARPADAVRVISLLEERWRALAIREGTAAHDSDESAGVDQTIAARVSQPSGAETACPACGCAAPLEGGACSDCGLQLE